MGLPSDLISRFVKATKDNKKTKTESTSYGEIVEYNGRQYVKLDGSELLTPISSTSEAKDGERVTVMIKNHSAIVTGNLSSPAARTDSLKETDDRVTELGMAVADKVSTKELEAEKARIETLEANDVKIYGRLDANDVSIGNLEADNVSIKNKLTAAEGEITQLKTDKLDANYAEITYATIENLEATDAYVHNLEATYGEFVNLTTQKFEATDATIENLNTKYANIDFSNIGQVAMEYFYSTSGLIKNVVVGDATIAGELVGVTIKGDLIEGETIVAEKLVIKGEDGLFYKLNTDGMKVEAEQTDYNSLNGQILTAKSVTAEKIVVEDLVAFGATIGGFSLTDSSIYSGVKSSVDNTTRGIYLDKTGQVSFGDGTNYIKYYKDQNGNYKLAIAAESITFGVTSKSIDEAFDEIQAKADASIISSIEQFYQSTSPTALSGGSWSIVQPVWEDGKYIWRRTKVTYGNGDVNYSPSDTGVCITGNTGAQGPQGIQGDTGAAGADAITLTITASNGTIFKNNSGSTVLTAHVYKGGVEQSITDAGVCGSLGTIKWYKGTSTTAIKTAKTLTITASDVTNTETYTANLE